MTRPACTACGELLDGPRAPRVCPSCATGLRGFGVVRVVDGGVAVGDPRVALRGKLGPVPALVTSMRGAAVGLLSGLLLGLPCMAVLGAVPQYGRVDAWMGLVFWAVSGMVIGIERGHAKDFESGPPWCLPTALSAMGALLLIRFTGAPATV